LATAFDVPELRVAIGMLLAFPGLNVHLQAVAKPAHQLRDRREVRLMTQLAQPVREMPDAL
jgi:hypothetical protein